eukprot:scaffold17003_cov130-Skeletonema_dohrnii-CCMP3373.AAC.2
MARLCSSSGERMLCFGVRLYECGCSCFWRNEFLPLLFCTVEAENPLVTKTWSWRVVSASDSSSGLAMVLQEIVLTFTRNNGRDQTNHEL